MRDYRLDPNDEPAEIGFCIGCGDPILAIEPHLIFENRTMIHDHEDCALKYCRKGGQAA